MNASLTIPAIISIAGIWFWVAWLYRDYRVDLFRERLFAIRDDLFDLARNGQVQFANPAYGILRMQINGFIRFGDRVSLSWILALGFAFRGTPEESNSVVQEMDKRWEHGIAALDGSVQANMMELRNRVHREFVKQVLFASPLILSLSSVLVLPLAAMLILTEQVRQLFAKWLPQADAAAYSEGCFAAG
jgi:hypothetical protein